MSKNNLFSDLKLPEEFKKEFENKTDGSGAILSFKGLIIASIIVTLPVAIWVHLAWVPFVFIVSFFVLFSLNAVAFMTPILKSLIGLAMDELNKKL